MNLRTGLLAVAASSLVGCLAPGRVVERDSRARGLFQPFAPDRSFEAPLQDVTAALLHVLARRGIVLTAYDPRSGFVAWRDIGSGFVSLEAERHNALSLRVDPRAGSLRGSGAQGLPLGGSPSTVHGAARLRPTGSATHVFLRARSRRVSRPDLVPSDGAYERSLLAEVKTMLARSNRRPLRPPMARRRTPPSGGQASHGYSHGIFTGFADLTVPSLASVQAVGQHKVYPVALRQFWSACIDIVFQYDLVVDVSLEAGRVVFVHGMKVPGANGALCYAETMIVLYVTPRGPDGTNVYIAALRPTSSEPVPLEDLSGLDTDAIVRRMEIAPRAVVATLVSQAFVAQLSTQVFHTKSWGDKLRTRSAREE